MYIYTRVYTKYISKMYTIHLIQMYDKANLADKQKCVKNFDF